MAWIFLACLPQIASADDFFFTTSDFEVWTETGFKGDLFMKLLLHIMMEETNGFSPFPPAYFSSR